MFFNYILFFSSTWDIHTRAHTHVYCYLSKTCLMFTRYDSKWASRNANMQPCGESAEQVNATIQEQTTCLYEGTIDDIICAFMQIANYKSWLKGSSTGRNLDSTSLKLKVTAHCGDPKLLADATKSNPWVEVINTRECVWEGSELFDSTKRKLNLPPGANCDSHRFEK